MITFCQGMSAQKIQRRAEKKGKIIIWELQLTPTLEINHFPNMDMSGGEVKLYKTERLPSAPIRTPKQPDMIFCFTHFECTL